MAAPIRITISANDGAGGADPTVEDLADQLRDLVALLHRLDNPSGKGKGSIVWRVTDVAKRSPISIVITPYPATPGEDIGARAAEVLETAARGIGAMVEGDGLGEEFPDTEARRAKRILTRVTNGLSGTDIDLSGYEGLGAIEIDRDRADEAVRRIREAGRIERVERELWEEGSVEGIVIHVARPGPERRNVLLASGDGRRIDCEVEEDPEGGFGAVDIDRIWEGLQVRVTGEILRDAEGAPRRMRDVHRIEPLSENGEPASKGSAA